MTQEITRRVETKEGFVPYNVSIASKKGLQSRVDLGEYDGMYAIRKLAGEDLPHDTLQEMFMATIVYRKQLQDAGLKVPHNVSLRVNGGLETIDEFVEGVELDTALRMGEGEEGTRKLVRTLCDLQDKDLFVDAKPANWIEKDGELHFIDMFPPPLKGEDGHIVPWVQEVYKRERLLFTFNYGDIRGQTTKMLAQARFSYPDEVPMMERAVLEELEGRTSNENYTYVREQIEQNYPDMDHFYNGDNIVPRLEELL